MIAFNHPACALRRDVILKLGGYRQAFWPAEDCDLWARVVEAGHRVAVQDAYLLKYRIHGTSASIARARLMQQKTIWLERCIAARRAKEPEPTWEQFQSEAKPEFEKKLRHVALASQPLVKRAAYRVRDNARRNKKAWIAAVSALVGAVSLYAVIAKSKNTRRTAAEKVMGWWNG